MGLGNKLQSLRKKIKYFARTISGTIKCNKTNNFKVGVRRNYSRY